MMELEAAVAVLNRHRLRGRTDWRAQEGGMPWQPDTCAATDSSEVWLTEWEAVTLARALEPDHAAEAEADLRAGRALRRVLAVQHMLSMYRLANGDGWRAFHATHGQPIHDGYGEDPASALEALAARLERGEEAP